MNQSISLESELENLIRAIEEIVQIIISIEQKKNAIAQSKNEAEKNRLSEEMKEDINQLSNKQNDLNLVKNSLNEPGILQENENKQTEQINQNQNTAEIIDLDKSSIANDKLTPAQEKEKTEIAKELESIASDAEMLDNNLSEDTVKYSSLLNSLGHNILLFDQRLEALKTRMQNFFESIPDSLKTNTALFFINRLENVNSKIQALKDKISENIQTNDELVKSGNKELDSVQNNTKGDASVTSEAQENIINVKKEEVTIQETVEQVPDVGGISLPSSDDFIIKEEQKMKAPSFQTARQMIVSQNGNEFFTIKQLISGIQTNTTALQHEIAVKEQSFIQNEKQIQDESLKQNDNDKEHEYLENEQLENQWELER